MDHLALLEREVAAMADALRSADPARDVPSCPGWTVQQLTNHISAVHRWVLLRILMTPVVFLVSVPVAIVRPDLAKFLWLLLFPVGMVLRRLEPPEAEWATPESGDQPD